MSLTMVLASRMAIRFFVAGNMYLMQQKDCTKGQLVTHVKKIGSMSSVAELVQDCFEQNEPEWQAAADHITAA